jgi:hypothetical protein
MITNCEQQDEDTIYNCPAIEIIVGANSSLLPFKIQMMSIQLVQQSERKHTVPV